jgi:hypothetical protein
MNSSATLRFLQAVLPHEGYKVAIVKTDRGLRHTFTTDFGELEQTLLRADASGQTVYHACGAFTKKGSRKAENVIGAKSFWLDIDAGEGKDYPDAASAAQAVSDFCRSTGLPPPIYVGSGNGLHVYWPLAEMVDPVTWRKYAGGLKQLCQSHDLAADPARTADISSILRPPGTHNRKGGEKLVECGDIVGPYDLERFVCFIRAVDTRQLPERIRDVEAKKSLVSAALQLYGNDPKHSEPIAAGCAQISSFRESGGDCPEPYWYAALGVLSYCIDGEKFGHEWSDSYEGYTYKETQERLERQKNFGPTTCERFASLNPKGCEGCPHAGKITSPIQLGRAVQTHVPERTAYLNGHYLFDSAVSVDQDLPPLPGEFCWQDRALVVKSEHNGGKAHNLLVSKTPIYLTGVQTREIQNDRFSLNFRMQLPKEGWKEISISAKDFFGSSGISEMADKGAVIHDAEWFKRYVRQAIDKYHAENKLQLRFDQYGWKDDDTSFLYGNHLYTSTAVMPVLGSTEVQTRNQWLGPNPGGSLERWSRAANTLFMAGCEPQSFALLCSFAAPLMRFHSSGEGGAIISLVNAQSGTGKTTALEAVASVWGREEGIKLTDNDTKVSKSLTLAALGNLPCTYDELFNRDPDVIRRFVLDFTNGRDRLRGTQSGEIRHTKATWQTILAVASNNSLVDTLSSMDDTDAPAFRIMEFQSTLPPGINRRGDELKRELKANSGYAGDAYLRRLVQPEIIGFIKQALPKWTDQIWQRTGLRSEHRFWVRTIASVIAASTIVHKYGILDFSPQRITDWILTWVAGRINEGTITNVRTAEGMLADFLSEHIADTLVMPRSYHTGIRRQIPVMHPKRQLLIRYDVEDQKIIIHEGVFRKWLVKHGMSPKDVFGELKIRMILKAMKKVTLGAGTDYASGQTSCVEVNYKHPGVSGDMALVEELQAEPKTRADRINEYDARR